MKDRGETGMDGGAGFCSFCFGQFFPLVEAQGKEGTDLRLRGQEQIPGSAGSRGQQCIWHVERRANS